MSAEREGQHTGTCAYMRVNSAPLSTSSACSVGMYARELISTSWSSVKRNYVGQGLGCGQRQKPNEDENAHDSKRKAKAKAREDL
jgi:hypothetical protein